MVFNFSFLERKGVREGGLNIWYYMYLGGLLESLILNWSNISLYCIDEKQLETQIFDYNISACPTVCSDTSS